jgi:hypothetical protein
MLVLVPAFWQIGQTVSGPGNAGICAGRLELGRQTGTKISISIWTRPNGFNSSRDEFVRLFWRI